ncbi:MAG TPA: hypothetical protein VGK87_13495 [Anaerolineae bacterium]|jgi:hypothetical protein
MMAQRKSIEFPVESIEYTQPRTAVQSGSDQLQINRLIVLVPRNSVNISALARRVWSLAEPCAIPVLYLAISDDGSELDGDARLRMVTLASMTRDDKVAVDYHLEPDHNWVRAVHTVWQPGDAVICLSEHKINLKFHGHAALSQVLESVLAVPVYVLPGLFLRNRAAEREAFMRTDRAARLLSRFLFPVLIMAGFLLTQLHISLNTAGTLRTLLLSFSGLVEIGVVGVFLLTGQ